MDRTRPVITRFARRLRGILILWGGLLPAAGCGSLLGDGDRVVALELLGGTARSVAAGDTLQLVVRALTAGGDTVPGAVIRWDVLDTGVVAFDLDGTLGRVVGVQPGKGRIQASHEHLRTDPVTVTVTAAAPSPARVAR